MNHKNLITFGLLIFLIVGFGCEAPNTKVVDGPKVIDIEAFLSTQYPQLASQGKLRKKAIINDSVEVQTVSYTEAEWQKELRFFSKSNINRKSWVDYFKIDSSQMDQGGLQIRYQTDKEQVPVKECLVRKNQSGQIEFLSMQIHRSNPISALERRLIYAFPDSIIIQNLEQLWLVDDQNIKIVYTWHKSSD